MSRPSTRQLAEQHVWEHFRPDSAPLILADELTMQTLMANLRRRGNTERRRRRNPPTPTPDIAPRSGFYLYRLWTADGRLLYVGVSIHLSARLRVHRSRWGDLIHRITWEEQPDERAMLTAERKAITDEDPAFNSAGIG